MPKGKLEFNLPEEQTEFDMASQAGEMYGILIDICDYLRSMVKYQEMPEAQAVLVQSIRDKLYELSNERGVKL